MGAEHLVEEHAGPTPDVDDAPHAGEVDASRDRERRGPRAPGDPLVERLVEGGARLYAANDGSRQPLAASRGE